jgi:recombination protein RecA
VTKEAEKTANRALKLILSQINKPKKGEEKQIKIGRLGEIKALNVPAISTGSLALDLALGVGGVPHGRMIEIFGPESSGKTTLGLHIIAEAQREGHRCAFIDMEHTLDPSYAASLGVEIVGDGGLLFSQPDSGDEAMEIIDKLVGSGLFKVVVLDSVASLTTDAEMEADITANHMGQQARLMSQALKRLTIKCGQTGTIIVFINQIRMKIGVMYGNPETTSGGNALKFYASQRLNIRRAEPIKEGKEFIGAKTKVTVVKNKVAPPFKVAHFNIMYGKGIDKEADIITVAMGLGIVERAGAWYSYKGERLGQGLESAITTLKGNPEMLEEIRGLVLAEVLLDEAEETDGN